MQVMNAKQKGPLRVNASGPDAPSLNAVLRRLKLTTSAAEIGNRNRHEKHIHDRSSAIVYTGTADDVWRWLLRTNQIAYADGYKPDPIAHLEKAAS